MKTPLVNLASQIPESILNDSEEFVLFLNAYYEWMHTSTIVITNVTGTFQAGETVFGETSGAQATIKFVNGTNLVVLISTNKLFETFETITGLTSDATATLDSFSDNILRKSANLVDYRNIARSADKFSEYLRDELYSSFPLTLQGDDRLVARKLKDYYSSKGQEEAYKFLFRTLYNQEATLTYPGDEILIASDGKFVRDTIIRTSLIGDPGSDDIFYFLFKTIRGTVSGASAYVIDMKKVIIGDLTVAEMKLELTYGEFVVGENIFDIRDTNIPRTEATLYGMVTGFEVSNPGSGYQPGDFITITGDGNEASAKVTDVSVAEIDAIKVTAYGHGYQLGTLATVDNTGTGGEGLMVQVTEITNTYPVTISSNTYTVGEVSKVSIVSRGEGYYIEPVISLVDSTVANAGMLTEKYITIANGGNTYTTGDLLSFSGPPGYSANAEVSSVDLGLQSRTNYIRNSTMVGANAVSNTLPTNWSRVITNGGTLITQVVRTGIEGGVEFIDVRISGTSGTGSEIEFYYDTATSTDAIHGETWAGSVYLRSLITTSGSISSTKLAIGEYTSGGTLVNQSPLETVSPTSSALSSQRFSQSRSLTGGSTVAKVRFSSILTFPNSTAINITLRIGLPQLEKNYFASSPIRTTNTAITIEGYGEPTRINYVRNGAGVGAIAGTPGTAPTYWTVTPGTSITSEIVGSGVEDGVNYVDLRFSGENLTGSTQFSTVRFESNNQISAIANSVWASSAYIRRVSGATSNVANVSLIMTNYSSVGAALNQYSNTIIAGANLESSSIAANKKIVVSSNTSFSDTSTAYIQPYLQFQVANNRIIDITFRVGGIQTEFGNTATSLITTTGVSARRPSNNTTNDYNITLETDEALLNEETSDYLKYDTTDSSISAWAGIGKISKVRMINYGLDYQANNLPTITVNTNTGSGANLVCTNIQGLGTLVEVDTANNTQNIGGIRKIEPLSYGVDYTFANTVVIGAGNENAVVNGVISSIATSTGVYVSDDGKLDYKKLQDSYFYQKFSYVINSGIAIPKYRETIKKLLHPAGLEIFGQLSIINNLDLTMQSDTVLLLDEISTVIKQVIKYLDNVTVTKVQDFIADDEYATYAELLISQVADEEIGPYDKYRFNSQYGTAVYFQVEKHIKQPGKVEVYSSNNVVIGTGTSFTSSISSGDDIVISDKFGTDTVHRVSVDSVSNNIHMILRISPSINLSNSDIFTIEI